MSKKMVKRIICMILAVEFLLESPIYGKAEELEDINNIPEIINEVTVEAETINENSNEDDDFTADLYTNSETIGEENNETLNGEIEPENKVLDEDVINRLVDYINKGEYTSISSLYQKDKAEELNLFLNSEDNKNNYEGIYNVISANIIDCTNVKYEDVMGMLYEEYNNTPQVYVVGFDLKVHEDTKYFYNGINYFLISFSYEDDTPRIVEMISISEPKELLNKGYIFSNDYKVALKVMEARKTGEFINGYGVKFDSINGNMYFLDAVKNKRAVPTSKTVVRYKNSKGKTVNINFHNYCLGVLAGELRGKDYDGAVRQAQAIAIKTFTWHYIIVPQGPTTGYDLTYASQSYVPSKVSENSKVTTDYNAVKNIWMESYSGAIFAAYYKLGKYQNQTTLKHCGEFKQDGARWLKDNKVAVTYKGLLKYYYDNSSASTGGAIRFFDGKKNEL